MVKYSFKMFSKSNERTLRLREVREPGTNSLLLSEELVLQFKELPSLHRTHVTNHDIRRIAA